MQLLMPLSYTYSINARLTGHINWLVCQFLVPLAMDYLNLLAFPHLTSDVEIHSELAYKADSVTQSDNDFGNDVGCDTVIFIYIMFAWCS